MYRINYYKVFYAMKFLCNFLVDSVFNQINLMNENLHQLMRTIDYLCKLLPDDLKMEDSIPVPLLTLENHSEVYLFGMVKS